MLSPGKASFKSPRKTKVGNSSPCKGKSNHAAITPKSTPRNQEEIGEKSCSNVRVLMRSRPMNEIEKARNDVQAIRMENGCSVHEMQVVSLNATGMEMVRNFAFDACISETVSQQDVFRSSGIVDLIESAFKGFSATVFAYGQTSSGKTFSMSGIDELIGNAEKKKSEELDTNDGIIPRSMQYIFGVVEKAQKGMKHSIRASYCEIYNESVYDLLNVTSDALHVRWNDNNGFFVQNLLIVQCDSLDDITAVVEEGHRNRRVDSHALNKDSSRSHSLLTVYFDTEIIDDQDGHVLKKFGKLTFVDLAGSERIKDTKSTNYEETSSINKSLFTLGKVISALGSATKSTAGNFVPYRDSKLTKLLMDSLGGNCLTLMIACVSPSSHNLDETLSTLNYATRAKNIRNKPMVQIDPKEQLIFNLRQEIRRLQVENEYLRQGLPDDMSKTPAKPVNPSPPSRPSSKSSSRNMPHQLPPVEDATHSPRVQQRKLMQPIDTSDSQFQVVLDEFHTQVASLQDENNRLRMGASYAEQSFQAVMIENEQLRGKLDHLEQVFVNSKHDIHWNEPDDALFDENEKLKQDIHHLQAERDHLILQLKNQAPTSSSKPDDLRQENQQLQERLEHYQRREKELMKAIARRNRSEY